MVVFTHNKYLLNQSERLVKEQKMGLAVKLIKRATRRITLGGYFFAYKLITVITKEDYGD